MIPPSCEVLGVLVAVAPLTGTRARALSAFWVVGSEPHVMVKTRSSSFGACGMLAIPKLRHLS